MSEPMFPWIDVEHREAWENSVYRRRGGDALNARFKVRSLLGTSIARRDLWLSWGSPVVCYYLMDHEPSEILLMRGRPLTVRGVLSPETQEALRLINGEIGSFGLSVVLTAAYRELTATMSEEVAVHRLAGMFRGNDPIDRRLMTTCEGYLTLGLLSGLRTVEIVEAVHHSGFSTAGMENEALLDFLDEVVDYPDVPVEWVMSLLDLSVKSDSD